VPSCEKGKQRNSSDSICKKLPVCVLILEMNRKIGALLFLVFFAIAVGTHYSEYKAADQSLFLAHFEDPANRFSFYPWLVESARQFRSGRFTLWTENEGAGFPLLANYQSSPLNPFNLAFTIFPGLKFLDLIVIIKLILLGVFTYLFCLELGLAPVAGAGASVIICFSGYVSKNINQINLSTELWLPAGLLLVERVFKYRASFLKILLLGLVSSLALLGGNPEAGFYFLLIILLYCLLRGGWQKRGESLAILIGLAFGFFLASAQLLSFIEYLGWGWNIHSPSLHTIGRPKLQWFFSLFFPWIFGPNRSFSAQLFLLGYIGLIPLLLAVFALFSLKPGGRSLKFFWVCTLIFLALVYRIPPFYFLSYLPVFNRIASVKFAYFGVCFSMAMLAGFGLENYFQNRLKARQFALALAAVSGLAFLSLVFAYQFPLVPYPRFPDRSEWVMPLILFVIAAGAVFYGVFFEERKLSSALLVFLALINLLHLYPGLRPEGKIDPGRWRFENPDPPAYLRPVINDRSFPRLTGLNQAFHPNLNLIFGIDDFRVFEGMYPKSYVQAMAELEKFSMEDAVLEFFRHGWSFDINQENLGNPLVNQLGIKYLVSPREINIPGWEKIFSADGHILYLNQNPWPRVWLQLKNGQSDLQSAQIIEYFPDRLTLEVGAKEAADLILADQYAPGWKAELFPSGRELRIVPDGLFRKVPIEPGQSKILFRYKPLGFRVGLYLSLAAVASFLAGIILCMVKTRKN